MWRRPVQVFIVVVACVLPLVPFCRSCGANSYNRRRDRTKNPLRLKERQPDMAEFAVGASGPSTGKISGRGRNDSRLVPCYNTNIIFKDNEETGADRLMTRNCRAKLNELARLVKNDPEWSKLETPIRLRVIEAWDEDNEHSEHSLHYEGRAVDITTSDRDEKKYGKLGRLARDAGFDWVYYAARSHIHASVRKDGSTESGASKGCFSGDSRVMLRHGQSVAMKDLKIGDQVEAMSDNGEITFSEVLMFIDNQPRVPGVSHCVIETDKTQEKIFLTPRHLIFTLESNANVSRLVAKHAMAVNVGDFVLGKDARGNRLVPRKVTRVYFERKTGAVAPLTSQGNIIVDGILASCYAETSDHGLAHKAFSPVRLWHRYSPATFKWKIAAQSGTHWYADFLIMLNDVFGVTSLS